MNEYDRKRQEQREESFVRMMEAAISCFGKSGYANTSMKDVAACAGVSLALVQKYFDSKENLLSEAYRYATAQTYPMTDGEQTLRQRVEKIISQSVEAMKEKPAYYDFFMMLIYTSDLPEIFLRTRRELFHQAPIYPALTAWMEEHGITRQEPYDYFMLFFRTHFVLIDYFRQFSYLMDAEPLNAGVMLTYISKVIVGDMKTDGADGREAP